MTTLKVIQAQTLEVAKVRFAELEAAWAQTKAVIEKHGRNSPGSK